MNLIKQYLYLLIFAVLVAGCDSKDVNSSEDMNNTIASEELNNTIVSEKYFVQDPSRVANADQTVYLRVEHPNLPDKHMSDDIGRKGCDKINYYIDDSLTAIEIGDDMDINVTLYKDGQEIVKASKGQQAVLNEEGQYLLKVCHSGYGYKNMHLPVFINKKSEAQKSPSLIYKASKLAASAQSGGTTLSFNNDCSNTTIQNLDFTHTNLNGINWTGCTVQNNTFDHSSFDMKTNFFGSTFLSNTFIGVTFFPQTLHGIPTFQSNHIKNSLLLAPSFVYKQSAYAANSTDLSNTVFENSHIYSPVFGGTVSYEVYHKPPWYDELLYGLEDAWNVAKTAKFWESVGEAAGIAVAMAGIAIVTDGAGDVAAGPALADALADSSVDIGEDVASDAAGDAGADAGGDAGADIAADTLPSDGEGLTDLSYYDGIEDFDTMNEDDLSSLWDGSDDGSLSSPEDANNICTSSFYNKTLVGTNIVLGGVGLGVSYLKHLQSGSPTSAKFFQKETLTKSIGAAIGMAVDKYKCDNTAELANRNLVAGAEIDTRTILKQIAKSVAISLGIDAISAFAKDVSARDANDEALTTTFAGLEDPNNDISIISAAYGELLVDDNATKFFQAIKRHYLASEISKITAAADPDGLKTGPAKMQQMSLSMQANILDQLKTGGTQSDEYMAIMTDVDFKNCIITTPQFGDLSSFNFEFGDMTDSMIVNSSTSTLPPTIFYLNPLFLSGLTLYGGTYDLQPLLLDSANDDWEDIYLNGSGATIYNAVFNNVVYLDLNNSTLVNTQINLDANYDFDISIKNSKLLNKTEIILPNGGANQNLVFTNDFIGNSNLNFPTNTKVDFTGTKIQNLNECDNFSSDTLKQSCMDYFITTDPTKTVTHSPITSATQNWSYSSLSCQDIMNVGNVDDFFAQATGVDLEGVRFEYSDGCDLTGLLDKVKADVINNTKNLSIDYNITGIKNVYSLNDRLTYDIIIPGMIVDGTNIDGSDSDTGLDLSNKDLRDITFSNLYFIDVNLVGVNFSGATFTNVTFYQPDIEGLDLPMEDVNFSNAIFNNVKFYNEISNSDFSYAVFENSPFILESDPSSSELGTTKISNSIWYGVTGANLCTYVTYETFGTSLIGADLNGCDMTLDGTNSYSNWTLIDANLSHAQLSYVDFSDANLTGADLSDANLTGATFSGTILTNVNWQGAIGVTVQLCDILSTHPDAFGKTLIGADLTQCNIDNFDFTGWDLHDANFTNHDLTNINFANANLKRVNWTDTTGICNVINAYTNQLGESMVGANLNGCTLTDFDFTQWDLRGVNFTGFTLDDINFTNANLQGATLSGYDDSYGITLPTQKDSLRNINWEGVDSTSLCPIVTNNVEALGKTMIGADLSECMDYSTSLYAGWNLTNSILPFDFGGDMTCTNVTNATSYPNGYKEYGFIYSGTTICGSGSVNGLCQNINDGTCQ